MVPWLSRRKAVMVKPQPSVAPAAPIRRREGAIGRKDVAALLASAALVLLVYVWLSAREALDAPAQGDPAAAGPLRAVLVVGTVEVMPTKADGKRWDVGIEGLPDPHVTVVNKTQNVRRTTDVINDTLKAVFNVDTVPVQEGDELYLRVVDVDVQFDDLIGEHRFRVTREMIEQGEMELKFGQVKRMTIRFKR
jgi:hypothetical protein